VTNFDDPQYVLGKGISDVSGRLKEIESKDNAIYEVKTTTGDPVSRGNYHFVINTFDNTFKVYADGGWRTLASGW